MREFSRITMDWQHLGGQACIRGLPITVSDIAKVILSGKSSAEVLQQFPELEQEDIVEALAWGVQDLETNIAYFKNEGLTPLSHIHGYSEFLVNQLENSNIDQYDLKLIEDIYHNSRKAVNRWQELGRWAQLKYRFNILPLQKRPQSFHDLLAQCQHIAAEKYLLSNKQLKSITENDLLEIEIDLYLLAEAMVTLMYSDLFGSFRVNSEIHINRQVDQILIKIHREFEYKPYKLDVLDYVPAPLEIAALIIKEHGSELKIALTEVDAVFFFDLPMYNV